MHTSTTERVLKGIVNTVSQTQPPHNTISTWHTCKLITWFCSVFTWDCDSSYLDLISTLSILCEITHTTWAVSDGNYTVSQLHDKATTITSTPHGQSRGSNCICKCMYTMTLFVGRWDAIVISSPSPTLQPKLAAFHSGVMARMMLNALCILYVKMASL